MAKLKGPLFSLGASQQLGKALVYFNWKGLNVVREYVVPANPKTALQTTQRGYLTDAVALIHFEQGIVANPFDEDDMVGYALWASVVQAATTWFNQACRNYLDQRVAGKTGYLFRNVTITPGADQLYIGLNYSGVAITAGVFRYGTSKTALINSKAATVLATSAVATITALVTGTKYYMQFVPSAPAGAVGAKSGIYYGVPT